jgi:hypothetical protein
MNTRFKVFASYHILQYLCDFIHVLIFVTVSKCRKNPKLTNVVFFTLLCHIFGCIYSTLWEWGAKTYAYFLFCGNYNQEKYLPKLDIFVNIALSHNVGWRHIFFYSHVKHAPTSPSSSGCPHSNSSTEVMRHKVFTTWSLNKGDVTKRCKASNNLFLPIILLFNCYVIFQRLLS